MSCRLPTWCPVHTEKWASDVNSRFAVMNSALKMVAEMGLLDDCLSRLNCYADAIIRDHYGFNATGERLSLMDICLKYGCTIHRVQQIEGAGLHRIFRHIIGF